MGNVFSGIFDFFTKKSDALGVTKTLEKWTGMDFWSIFLMVWGASIGLAVFGGIATYFLN
jgi:hypothetical protein